MGNRSITFAAVIILATGLAACSTTMGNGQEEQEMVNTSNVQSYDLAFNPDVYTVETLTAGGTTIRYRAYEGIVYVANPVDTTYQSLNFYVPEEYFEGESINGFTLDTAPIFLPNQVGGYMPGLPGSPRGGGFTAPVNGINEDVPSGMGQGQPEGMTPPDQGDASGGRPTGKLPVPPAMVRENLSNGSDSPNAIFTALSKGYAVASPGARGRTLQNEYGTYYGKAPAAIVDLKAAVRYLHYNDSLMAGDAGKIISNGTSAGGALSALLGASGNSKDYEPYLDELGAADASDAIFAVSAYCPITNLDNADMAYEWLYGNILVEQGTDDEATSSAELKKTFAAYVNGLGLKDADGTLLTLDENGEGPFAQYVKSFIVASAQKALGEGTDLSDISWLTIEDRTVIGIDWDAYAEHVTSVVARKGLPAFDAFDASSAENNLFGTGDADNLHFTQFGLDNDEAGVSLADSVVVKMMNPMYYIGAEGTDTAQYWRIRHGSMDRDTSLAVPVILGTALENAGFPVDVASPWGQGHGGDYDLDELFAWMDSISR